MFIKCDRLSYHQGTVSKPKESALPKMYRKRTLIAKLEVFQGSRDCTLESLVLVEMRSSVEVKSLRYQLAAGSESRL